MYGSIYECVINYRINGNYMGNKKKLKICKGVRNRQGGNSLGERLL